MLQRKCACGGSAGLTGECAECQSNRLLGKPKGTPTKQHWKYIYRKDRVSGRMVPVADPGRLFVGETLYYVPNGAAPGGGAGAKSGHDPGKPVSDDEYREAVRQKVRELLALAEREAA